MHVSIKEMLDEAAGVARTGVSVCAIACNPQASAKLTNAIGFIRKFMPILLLSNLVGHRDEKFMFTDPIENLANEHSRVRLPIASLRFDQPKHE